MIKEKTIVEVAVFFIIGSLIFRFDNMLLLDRLFTMLALGASVFIPLFIKYNRALSNFIIPIVIIFAYVIILTYYNRIVDNGSILVVYLLKGGILIYLLGKYLPYKADTILVIISKVFLSFALLNLLQVLFAPNLMGMTDDGGRLYLIANNYNSFGGILMPGILASYVISAYDKKNSIICMSMLTITLITVIIVGSVTSIIGYATILLYIIMSKHCKSISKYASVLLIGIILAFFLLIISNGYSFLDKSSIMRALIDYSGKEITFSGRAYIWQYGIDIIKEHICYGIGYYQGGDWAESYIKAKHVHNTVLDILLCGGVALISFITFLLYKLYRRLRNINIISIKNGVVFISLVYLLMLQFEVYNYCLYIIFLFIVYISAFLTKTEDFRYSIHT